MDKRDLERVGKQAWEVPQSFRGDMRVPARFYTSERMLDAVLRDRSIHQLVKVATLPGILTRAIAMPDVHEGYGFPIGGVAATDPEEGVISPGGIGYDINCGVRMLRSRLRADDVKPRLRELARAMAREIPAGAGKGGGIKMSRADLDLVLRAGARRAVEMGNGSASDLDHAEDGGRIAGADPAAVSERARDRGIDQLGTIGSGNHFVEVDVVDRIDDDETAQRFGVTDGQVTLLIHTGSRGLGHQVATDYLKLMNAAMPRYQIRIPDPQLACVPVRSPEGQKYLGAMRAAANFAFANRQMITAALRRAWRSIFGESELSVLYDVAHNIAKLEPHVVNGKQREVIVHRKGATRSFPGQPVLIPGSMGTASYLLSGQQGAMEETFGSSCHGAGRVMSRGQAKREIRIAELRERLERSGIVAESQSHAGLVEEAPEAYKDVDEVVGVVHDAGIATRVARVRPIAVVKG
ncbi:MAG TPA: RtcB family protein [Thermoanaerobaculia bacterium]|nr:RtcB family protein [Thermoanaerobaculia bacterium]